MRKVRGLLGVGVTWGGLWAALGAGVGLLVGLLRPDSLPTAEAIVKWAGGLGLYGFASGVGFGGLIALREARGSVFDVSLGRAARWGVLGGAAVPLLFGALGMFEVGTTTAEVVAEILVTASLGGIFAPAVIGLARRGELEEAQATARLSPGAHEPEAGNV